MKISQTGDAIGHPCPHAVICHANYARFHPDWLHILNVSVKSRMCLWCKSGRGRVVVNCQAFDCEHGDYFLLPWNHRVEYFADPVHPFQLAGIHIVPDHALERGVEYIVPHEPTHPLSGCSWRKDVELPGLEAAQRRRLAEDSPLWLLSESIVQLFLRGVREESALRLLAQSLVLELIRGFGPDEADPIPPPALRRAQAYVESHLARPISVGDLAREAERSRSGVTGLFRTHCGVSPVQWVNRRRMDRARELLATTGLPVGEIGSAVGIEDPYYFSRLFKRLTGLAPRAYRKKNQHF